MHCRRSDGNNTLVVTSLRFRFSHFKCQQERFDVSQCFRHDDDMPWTERDYQRLGDLLRAARRDAGYRTLKDFQDYLDSLEDKEMSGRTYADIENGRLGKRKSFNSDSLAYLEDLFGWRPGVHRLVLDGQKVDVYTGVSLEDTQWRLREGSLGNPWSDEVDDAMADVDTRLEALERRVLELERRTLGTRAPRINKKEVMGNAEHPAPTSKQDLELAADEDPSVTVDAEAEQLGEDIP